MIRQAPSSQGEAGETTQRETIPIVEADHRFKLRRAAFSPIHNNTVSAPTSLEIVDRRHRRRMTAVRALVILLLMAASFAMAYAADNYSGNVATANQELRPKGAHLSLRSVLRIAQTEASLHGISPTAFEASQFTYSCDSDECEWRIAYVGKVSTWRGQTVQLSMIPIVHVNDRTQRAQLAAPLPFVDVIQSKQTN